MQVEWCDPNQPMYLSTVLCQMLSMVAALLSLSLSLSLSLAVLAPRVGRITDDPSPLNSVLQALQ